MGDEVTIEILKQIRDELRSHGEKHDRTNERLDRVVQEQIRHATAIVALEAGQRELAEGQRELAGGQRALVQAVIRLDEGQRAIVDELRALNRRVDHVLMGPVGSTVRDTSARVDALEVRIAAVEKRIG